MITSYNRLFLAHAAIEKGWALEDIRELFDLVDDVPIPLVPSSEEECPPTLRSAEITPAPVARRHCIPVEVR